MGYMPSDPSYPGLQPEFSTPLESTTYKVMHICTPSLEDTVNLIVTRICATKALQDIVGLKTIGNGERSQPH